MRTFEMPIEEQRVAVVQATGNERLKWSGPMFCLHLQTMTGQPAVADAAGSSRFDRPQRREPTVTAGCRRHDAEAYK